MTLRRSCAPASSGTARGVVAEHDLPALAHEMRGHLAAPRVGVAAGRDAVGADGAGAGPLAQCLEQQPHREPGVVLVAVLQPDQLAERARQRLRPLLRGDGEVQAHRSGHQQGAVAPGVPPVPPGAAGAQRFQSVHVLAAAAGWRGSPGRCRPSAAGASAIVSPVAAAGSCAIELIAGSAGGTGDGATFGLETWGRTAARARRRCCGGLRRARCRRRRRHRCRRGGRRRRDHDGARAEAVGQRQGVRAHAGRRQRQQQHVGHRHRQRQQRQQAPRRTRRGHGEGRRRVRRAQTCKQWRRTRCRGSCARYTAARPTSLVNRDAGRGVAAAP